MPTALITGGSSGIGFELAKIFARDGYHLVLIASNQERLSAAKAELESVYPQISIRIIAKDLSKLESAKEIFNLLELEKKKVDVLVNNAGFGDYGSFAETDLNNEIKMIEVNITAVVQLTKFFLKDMIARRKGKILNTASIAGIMPGPYMAVYHASKAFVLSFTEAISEEVKGTGVTVTALCPASTNTGFFKRSSSLKKSPLTRGYSITPAEVAEIGYKALMKGQVVVIAAPLSQRITLGLARHLLSRGAIRKAIGRMYKR